MNCVLQKQPNNDRAVEIQLMRRFIRDTNYSSLLMGLQFTDEYSPVFRQLNILPPGSLGEALTDHQESKSVHVPKKYIRCVFDEADLMIQSKLYSKLGHREEAYDTGQTSTIFKKYLSINIGGKKYSATHINHHYSCICMARWNEAVLGRVLDVEATISTVSYDPYVQPIINEHVAGHRVPYTVSKSTHQTFQRIPNVFKLGAKWVFLSSRGHTGRLGQISTGIG